MSVLKHILNTKNQSNTYISQLTGIQFEHFTGNLLKSLGFKNVVVTQPSCDFGIDVIGTLNHQKIGFQCKHFKDDIVGYHAVEEADAGKDFYSLDKAVVITNSIFSHQAKVGAKRTNVELWDNKALRSLIGKSKFGSVELKPHDKYIVTFTHINSKNHQTSINKTISKSAFKKEFNHINSIFKNEEDMKKLVNPNAIQQFTYKFLSWNFSRIPSSFVYLCYLTWSKRHGYSVNITERTFVTKLSKLVKDHYIHKTSRLRTIDALKTARLFKNIMPTSSLPKKSQNRSCFIKI